MASKDGTRGAETEVRAPASLLVTGNLAPLAREALKEIVGKSGVSSDDGVLDEFTGDHSPAAPVRPALVVRPNTVEEVEGIVRLANEMGFALIPVSSAAPHFRGDTVSAQGDAVPAKPEVVLDMRSLDSIMWISRHDRVALVEAGVSFDRLQRELEKEGLRTLTPLCPKQGKSAVTAYMEREPLTAPRYHYDMSDPLCSAEFVLGNGDVFKTGSAGTMPGTWDEQRSWKSAQKNPFGTQNIDVKKICQGSQGSLGVCTWASLKLELLPEIEEVYFLTADSLGELVEPLYRLLYLRTADELFALDSTAMACLLSADRDRIAALREEFPPWILVATVAGFGVEPRAMIDYQRGDLMGTGFPFSADLPGVEGGEVLELMRKPPREPYWKTRLLGDVREFFFLARISEAPSFSALMRDLAVEAGYAPRDMGTYVQPQLQGACCHVEFDLAFAPGDPEGEKAVDGLVSRAAYGLLQRGAFFSRPYGDIAAAVYEQYREQGLYLGELKRLFDPQGVLSPGRLYCEREG